MQVTQERLLKRLATIIAKILYIGDLDPATLSDLAEMLRLIVRVKRTDGVTFGDPGMVFL